MPGGWDFSARFAAIAGRAFASLMLAFASTVLPGSGATDAWAADAGDASDRSNPGASAGAIGGAITGEPANPREALETTATKLLNEARSKPRNCGNVAFDAAPPLRWSGALAAAAASHSLWMQSTDSTSHEQHDGSRVGDRAEAAGYRWQAIAENIAAGTPTVADTIAGWLESPPHCENIMNPEYEEFAVARVDGTAGNRFPTWWTLVLARPQP